MKMKRSAKAACPNRIVTMNSGTLRALIRRNNGDNLRKLEQLGILDRFVKENNGMWDHQKWIDLCALIDRQELGPVDFDKVGLILEEKKSRYFSANDMCVQEFVNSIAEA